MGNCFRRCFGAVDKRARFPQTRYTSEQDFSIENYYMDDGFENLIGDEPSQNETTRLLTNRERQLLSSRQFGVLVHEQSRIDAEIEAKLAQQEKEIEQEEAAFNEAKREAARVAKLNKDKENSSRNNSKAWVDNEEWEIAGGEDDFENFLADVRARSLVSRSPAQNENHEPKQPTNTNTSSDHDWDADFVGADDDEKILS